ncbi:sister chromatid cohesion protein DCC1-like [Ciona intestinalis]
MCDTDILSDTKDVRARLELAKLDIRDLKQPIQILTFNEDANDQDVTLLELDKSVLQVIQNGGSLVIRGNEDDTAVLCTDDSTFSLKRAVTSNSLILVPDCTTDKDNLHDTIDDEISLLYRSAVGWKSDYLEMQRIHPQTSRLLSLLQQSYYKGPRLEEEQAGKCFTLSELMNEIQASEVEVMTFLCKINSCCIEGKWRLLDFGYIVECMGELLQLIECESWSCGRVPFTEAVEKINDSGELVPSFILKHLLGSYGFQVDSDEDVVCYQLDEAKICRFFAEMLLRDVSKFNLKEFLEVWKSSVPGGMVANEKYLLGLALIDKTSHPHTVKLFKVDQLPIDMQQRFNSLFTVKEKWTFEQIEPYIEDICVKGQTVSAMLTKYARSSNMDGVKHFSTRKPISTT